ncbi:hypothetical protein FRC17_011247 [Serendipita sp. 399]|nr:hypothetical protein FRC17_011247 [Serendipita sp. 399]
MDVDPEPSNPTLSSSSGNTGATKPKKSSAHKRSGATVKPGDAAAVTGRLSGQPSPIPSDNEGGGDGDPANKKRKRENQDALKLHTSGLAAASPGYLSPMSAGALSDASAVSAETDSEEEEEEGTVGKKPAKPKKIRTALITLIPPSLKGGGGTTTVQSTVKGAVAKAKIHATSTAIADVSKKIEEGLIEEWKDHEARKEGQNLKDPLEVVLTEWLMKYMWKQQNIGNIARADNEPAFGADATYVLEFSVEGGLKYVILVQFKVKHKSGINWTHTNTKGAQLWLLLTRANALRKQYPADTLVYAVFAAFTEHGILTYAAEDVALQFELLNPNGKTMDATVATRKTVEAALEQASPNKPGIGFLSKVIQLGTDRKDKDLQKEAKAKIHEHHPKPGGTTPVIEAA